MHLYLILTSFSISFLSLAMAVALLVRRGLGVHNLVFSAFNLSVFFWASSYFFWQLSDNPQSALFWCRMLAVGSTFIPVTYLHFISLVTGYRLRGVLLVGYLTATLLALMAPAGAVVSTVTSRLMFPFWPVPGPLFGAYAILFAGYVTVSFVILIRKLRTSNLYTRNQLQYLFWGNLLGFIGGSTNFFLWFGVPIPPIGNGLGIVYILGTGYAMIKYRLMELDQMVARIVVFICAAFAVSVAGALFSFFFLRAVGNIYDVSHLFSHWLFAFGVILVLMWFLPMLRGRINDFLDTALAPGRRSGVDRLRQLAKDLIGRKDDADLFRYSVGEIGEGLRADSVAIYFAEEIDPDFHLKARYGDAKRGVPVFPADHRIVRRLGNSRNAMLLAEMVTPGQAREDAIVPPSAFHPHDLFFPIQVDETLSGFLVLSPQKGRRLHSGAALSLLDAICFQIGLLVRSRYIERRAAQVEKLISLGTLAAGLAHELRNPLVSIRTFAGLIGDQGDDVEFRRQFSSIVERDVNRIGAIIDQVAAFASNRDGNFAPVQISQVIQDVHDIAQAELTEGGVTLSVENVPLPPVHGNYSQLIQVFLNLLQNAVQALPGSASPAIRISYRLSRRKDGRQTIIVVVADNGPGIAPGIRSRIFDPFVTTKNTGSRENERGMGLGLGIVKCIVEVHGGSIEVASVTGAGTTFYVELPCEDGKKDVWLRK